MAAKTTPQRKVSETAALRKDLAEVKRELAKVQKILEKMTIPGKLQATKATVTSLELVDAEGEKLATLDAKGTLFCQKIIVAGAEKKNGIVIEGGEDRRITAGKLDLRSETSNKPMVEIDGDQGVGKVQLHNRDSKQNVWLQAEGVPLAASNDLSGGVTVKIASNGENGGRMQLTGIKKAAKSSAIIGISHHTSSGAVVLQDKSGAITGQLPV